ncbi:MAG: aspartyl-phosphate phosphatase Spo0E family protein [Clostridia bacterium]|nr:aspartyl-phosphate phosphatase Spo0E family protein [Clostridia bacterium]
MVEVQIEALQNELNHLIDRGYNFTEVYELSVKLDKLILQYYNERKV